MNQIICIEPFDVSEITTGDPVIYWVENKEGIAKRAAMITAERQNDKFDLIVFNPNGISHVSRVGHTLTKERGKFTVKELA